MDKTIIIAALLLVVGGVGYIIFHENTEKGEVANVTADNQSDSDATDSDTNSASGTNTTTSNNTSTPSSASNSGDMTPHAKIVLNENTEGKLVKIKSAELIEPGFIVIYEMNEPDNIHLIGVSRLLQAGTYNDYVVNTGAPINSDNPIIATVVVDNGTGEFSAENDVFATDADGIVADIDVVDVPRAEDAEEIVDAAKVYLKAQEKMDN